MKSLVGKGVNKNKNYSHLLIVFLIGVLLGMNVTPIYKKVSQTVLSNTINAIETDNIAPQVAITYPTSRMKVLPNMVLNVMANASDNVGVTYVDFHVSLLTKAPSASGGFLQVPGRKEYITLVHQCIDMIAPYVCTWNVPSSRNATYLIQAIGYDVAGNQGISKFIEFTVR